MVVRAVLVATGAAVLVAMVVVAVLVAVIVTVVVVVMGVALVVVAVLWRLLRSVRIPTIHLGQCLTMCSFIRR